MRRRDPFTRNQKNVKGAGEVLSCFVPHPDPLPSYQVSAADPNKLGVPLEEVPSEAEIPCPLYVYLPQNQKFICLIKTGGQLSTVQQERLLRQGLKFLMIAKEDKELFNMLYIRENLALPILTPTDKIKRAAG